MYKIIYEPEAQEDLLCILSYYAEEGGMALAENIGGRIEMALAGLSYLPFRSMESTLLYGTREFILPNLPYKAFLLIEESEKTIYVLNIVHTARKFP